MEMNQNSRIGMTLLMDEILNKIASKRTKKARVAELRVHDCKTLRSVFQLAYDPRCQWVYGKDNPVPEYTADDGPIGHNPSSLHQEIKKAYIFRLGGPNITDKKREEILVSLLNGLHTLDAELFVALISGSFAGRYKGITEKFVRDNIPGLLAPQPKKA